MRGVCVHGAFAVERARAQPLSRQVLHLMFKATDAQEGAGLNAFIEVRMSSAYL